MKQKVTTVFISYNKITGYLSGWYPQGGSWQNDENNRTICYPINERTLT